MKVSTAFQQLTKETNKPQLQVSPCPPEAELPDLIDTKQFDHSPKPIRVTALNINTCAAWSPTLLLEILSLYN